LAFALLLVFDRWYTWIECGAVLAKRVQELVLPEKKVCKVLVQTLIALVRLVPDLKICFGVS
jgi:hypothetical protein